MKNKLLAFTYAMIIVASNQLAVANCCSPSYCSTDPCCPSNWYIAASGSVAWHNDHKFTIPDLSATRDYKVGGGAAASIGYIFDICNQWDLRLEGEVLWRRNSLKNQTFFGAGTSRIVPASGHTQDIALMANLIADIPLFCDIDFYIGGGLGISFNQLTLSPANSTKKSSQLFAWQGMTGLSYNICQSIALTAGYRIFGTEKVSTPGGTKSSNVPFTQSIDIGLRFRL